MPANAGDTHDGDEAGDGVNQLGSRNPPKSVSDGVKQMGLHRRAGCRHWKEFRRRAALPDFTSDGQMVANGIRVDLRYKGRQHRVDNQTRAQAEHRSFKPTGRVRMPVTQVR